MRGGVESRLGDQGSGYWIGLHSIRRALTAYDREEPSQVLETVGRIWGTASIEELVNLGDSTPGRTLRLWRRPSKSWPRLATR